MTMQSETTRAFASNPTMLHSGPSVHHGRNPQLAWRIRSKFPDLLSDSFSVASYYLVGYGRAILERLTLKKTSVSAVFAHRDVMHVLHDQTTATVESAAP